MNSTYSCNTIHYSTNAEYREVLRTLFQMSKQPMDEETKDEKTKDEETKDEETKDEETKDNETKDDESMDTESIDNETKDELDYDETASSKFLNSVYEKTKNKKEFQKLFDLAAACMFSTDREIGLAVLFSYDYLALFYQVLELNTIDPSNISDSAPYQKLLQGLSRTPT